MNILYNLCANATWIVVDIAVAITMLMFVFSSANKGFINCLFGFVSTLLALFIAVTFAKGVMGLTGGFFGVREALETKWVETLSKKNGFNIDISGQDLSALLATQDLPSILVTSILKNQTGALEAGTTLAMVVGGTAAQLSATLLTGIALYILTKLAIKLLRKIINKVAEKIKLLNAINKILGAVVGLIKIILIISLIVSILSIFPSSANMKLFTNSAILSYFYNHNPLFVMIGWFL